jgi:TonB family protein
MTRLLIGLAWLALPMLGFLVPGPASAEKDDIPLMTAIDMLSRGQGAEALPSLQRLAREDSAPAQYALGVVYLEGKWVTLDRPRGVAWLQLVRDGYPGSQLRPLALEKSSAMLAKVMPGLSGAELIQSDRILAEFLADWQRRWALDVAAVRSLLDLGPQGTRATALGSNGRSLMIGCALAPSLRDCRLPEDFSATEHCAGTPGIADVPATADPDKGGEPRALPADVPNGSAVIRAHVDRSGYVCSSLLWKSSGLPELDLAALESVRRWRFVPGRRGTADIDSLVVVQVTRQGR